MRPLLLLSLLCLGACSAKPQLDYDKLSGSMNEDQAKALLPKAGWDCKGQPATRVCIAAVSELGGLKASRVVLVFHDGRLDGARVEYAPDSYAPVSALLDASHKRLGGKFVEEARAANDPVVAWTVADGVVASSPVDKKDGNIYVTWLSGKDVRAAGY